MLIRDIPDTVVKVRTDDVIDEILVRLNAKIVLEGVASGSAVEDIPVLTPDNVRLVLDSYLGVKKDVLMTGREVTEEGIGGVRLRYRNSTSFNTDTPSIPTVVLAGSADNDIRHEALKKIVGSDAHDKFLKRIKAINPDGTLKLGKGHIDYVKEM